MKKAIVTLLILILAISLAVIFRYQIIIPLATTGEPVPLDRSASVVPDGVPFEDSEVYVTLKIY